MQPHQVIYNKGGRQRNEEQKRCRRYRVCQDKCSNSIMTIQPLTAEHLHTVVQSPRREHTNDIYWSWSRCEPGKVIWSPVLELLEHVNLIRYIRNLSSTSVKTEYEGIQDTHLEIFYEGRKASNRHKRQEPGHESHGTSSRLPIHSTIAA